MTVSFDAATSSQTNVGGLAQLYATMTVGSGSNQATCIGIEWQNDSSIKNVTDNQGNFYYPITGTDSLGSFTTFRNIMYGFQGLNAGLTSFEVQFTTTTAFALMGVVSAFGVLQSQAFINGTCVTGSSSAPSVSISTNPGDMTLDLVSNIPNVPGSPSQTQAWVQAGSAGSYHQVAAGNSTVHSWTLGSSTPWAESGADFQAAPVAGQMHGPLIALGLPIA